MTDPTPIPFLDLQAQHRSIRAEVVDALTDVADSTRFILGPRVEAFEEAFAEYVDADHCVAVSSGTAALHLALIAAGVGPGDEVVTVAMTFVATSWAISYVGATPVFVDVDPETYTMDVAQLEAAITPRTKAILPVHLYGQPADLAPLLEVADRRGIPLIEDAAQAHGATYRGRRVGAQGLAGCFSFYPGKNLGAAGEGGAVATDDAAVAARVRALRDHAQGERYHHDELGFNYRMDGFQGAVLGVKLPHLEGWIDGRRAAATRYHQLLSRLPLTLPCEAEGRRHVWHLYVVLHPERDRLRKALDEANIGNGLHYPIPVHLQKAYADLGHAPGDFPVAERIAAECLSLPMFPELTMAQQEAVASVLEKQLA